MSQWCNSVTLFLHDTGSKIITLTFHFLVSYLCLFGNEGLLHLWFYWPHTSSSPLLPVYLTINARTRLDWRPCCSPQIWWEWCTRYIVSCCTVLCRSLLPRVRNPTAPGSSRWLCKASVSSTVLPCLTYPPSRYFCNKSRIFWAFTTKSKSINHLADFPSDCFVCDVSWSMFSAL